MAERPTRLTKEAIRRAKNLRRAMPLAERLLWNALQENHRQQPFHFRRQHPLPPYIVDFACIKAGLVVEIDGPSHDNRLTEDAHRDALLGERDYAVLRFSNEEVLSNLEGVVETILKETLVRLQKKDLL